MNRKRLTDLWIIFNVIVIFAFIVSSLYVWSFLNTEINRHGRYDNGFTTIPQIEIDGFHVAVGFYGWTADGLAIPTPLPKTIPNYPFITFWIAIIGNLFLTRSIIKKKPTQPKTKNPQLNLEKTEY